MPITVLCLGCSAKLTAPDSAAGKNVKCPKCQTLMAIPAPAPRPEAGPKFEVVEEPEPPPAPVRKPARDHDDDDDAAPMSLERKEKAERPKPRKRRDEDEDDEEDEEEPRPRRKKSSRRGLEGPGRRRSKRRNGSNPLASFGPAGTFGAVVAGIWLLGLLLGLILPVAFIIPVGIGYLIALAGGIWLLIIAFSDSVIQGLLCLFVPFYSLIYLISNWDTCKNPFLVQVGGICMLIITSCLAGVR